MKTMVLMLVFVAGSLHLWADEQMARLVVGGQTYTNVTITSVTAKDIYFLSSGGMGNARLADLSPALQQHFHYDAAKAQAAEAQSAQNKAAYHAELLHQPIVQAPDMSRPSAPTGNAGGKALWRSDFAGALSQAKSDNKLVLLDFTGSDWCPWCIKFDQEVLSTGSFNSYAQAKLELVKVDFPHSTPLPAEQQHANAALAQQFRVDGFPTYVLLTADGRELGRQVGYLAGGPGAFIAELDGFSNR